MLKIREQARAQRREKAKEHQRAMAEDQARAMAAEEPPRKRVRFAATQGDAAYQSAMMTVRDEQLAQQEYAMKGDSKVVVGWLAGLYRCKTAEHLAIVRSTQHDFFELLTSHAAGCRGVGQDWVRHVYREENSAADICATAARDEGTFLCWLHEDLSLSMPWRVSAAFDGGWKDGRSGSGFVIEIKDAKSERTHVVLRGGERNALSDALLSEARAARLAVHFSSITLSQPMHEWTQERFPNPIDFYPAALIPLIPHPNSERSPGSSSDP